MMYLVDTNIWLERMLDQEQGDEVGRFLSTIPASDLLITDFTFHSIGVILSRLGLQNEFLRFVQDVFIDHGVKLASVNPETMPLVVDAMMKYAIDFDDAYQYVAAEMADVLLVSFDKDFDRTPRGRITPGEIIASK